ncbi:hypothetical protein HDV05_004334 [Chytridiales sp. JEL 0842]|nr:hypothetical protein HDV05_004334 [Chytridiales sp. JEL 0842]
MLFHIFTSVVLTTALFSRTSYAQADLDATFQAADSFLATDERVTDSLETVSAAAVSVQWPVDPFEVLPPRSVDSRLPVGKPVSNDTINFICDKDVTHVYSYTSTQLLPSGSSVDAFTTFTAKIYASCLDAQTLQSGTDVHVFDLQIKNIEIVSNGVKQQMQDSLFERPFRVVRSVNGRVVGVHVHKDEPVEILNIKKAAAENFNTNFQYPTQRTRVPEKGVTSTRRCSYSASEIQNNLYAIQAIYDDSTITSFPPGANFNTENTRLMAETRVVMSSDGVVQHSLDRTAVFPGSKDGDQTTVGAGKGPQVSLWASADFVLERSIERIQVPTTDKWKPTLEPLTADITASSTSTPLRRRRRSFVPKTRRQSQDSNGFKSNFNSTFQWNSNANPAFNAVQPMFARDTDVRHFPTHKAFLAALDMGWDNISLQAGLGAFSGIVAGTPSTSSFESTSAVPESPNPLQAVCKVSAFKSLARARAKVGVLGFPFDLADFHIFAENTQTNKDAFVRLYFLNSDIMTIPIDSSNCANYQKAFPGMSIPLLNLATTIPVYTATVNLGVQSTAYLNGNVEFSLCAQPSFEATFKLNVRVDLQGKGSVSIWIVKLDVDLAGDLSATLVPQVRGLSPRDPDGCSVCTDVRLLTDEGRIGVDASVDVMDNEVQRWELWRYKIPGTGGETVLTPNACLKVLG